MKILHFATWKCPISGPILVLMFEYTILSILAHQMQRFLKQGRVQPPNHILIHKNKLKQRPKLNIFSRKLQNFLRQGGMKTQKSYL